MQLKWADSEAKHICGSAIDLTHANKLMVTNLPFTVTEEQMALVFRQYGDLRVLRIVRSHGGYPRPRCYIKYAMIEQGIHAWKETNKIAKFPRSNQVMEVHFCETKRHNKAFYSTVDIETFKTQGQGQTVQDQTAADFGGASDGVFDKEVYYEVLDSEGTPYYYHYKTNASTWFRPYGPNILIVPFEYRAPEVKQEESAKNVSARNDNYIRVMIRNLPNNFDRETLNNFCTNYSDILDAHILSDEELAAMGEVRALQTEVIGMVFVAKMEDAEDLKTELNGRSYGGRVIRQGVLSQNTQLIVDKQQQISILSINSIALRNSSSRHRHLPSAKLRPSSQHLKQKQIQLD